MPTELTLSTEFCQALKDQPCWGRLRPEMEPKLAMGGPHRADMRLKGGWDLLRGQTAPSQIFGCLMQPPRSTRRATAANSTLSMAGSLTSKSRLLSGPEGGRSSPAGLCWIGHRSSKPMFTGWEIH